MIARRRYHRAGVQGMQQSLPSIFALGATERAGAPAHGKDALAARCTARAAEAGRLRRAALALRSAAASCPPRTGCPKRARQNRHQHKPHGRRPPLTPLTRPHVRAAPAYLLVPGGVAAVVQARQQHAGIANTTLGASQAVRGAPMAFAHPIHRDFARPEPRNWSASAQRRGGRKPRFFFFSLFSCRVQYCISGAELVAALLC